MCDAVVRTGGARVCGLLFGREGGSGQGVDAGVEAFTATDMLMQGADTALPTLDARYLEEQRDLSWYACSSAMSPEYAHIHRQLLAFEASPIFIHMRTDRIVADAKELPIQAYVGVFSGSELTFDAVPSKIEATETESLISDAVSDITGADATDSPLVASLRASAAALRLLQERLGIIRAYLQAVKSGSVKGDRMLLRQIANVCARLPVSDSDRLSLDMLKDMDDGMLVSLLATMARTVTAIAGFTEKLNVVQMAGMKEHGGMRGGGFMHPAGPKRHRGPV